jgi:acetylornithine/succinyldiaminopimelate/putrescine aminotransferase
LGLSAEIFVSKLKEKGVLALPLAEKTVRMVTHRGVEGEHIQKAVGTIENIIDEMNSRICP